MAAPLIQYYVRSANRRAGPFDGMQQARQHALAVSGAKHNPIDATIIKETTQVMKTFTVQPRPAPVES